MHPLESITFDAGGFTFHGDEDGVRIWYSASGDGVGLYYFPIPPDIPADLKSVGDVRTAYRKLIAASGNALIEVETPLVDGCAAVRTISKTLGHGGRCGSSTTAAPNKSLKLTRRHESCHLL